MKKLTACLALALSLTACSATVPTALEAEPVKVSAPVTITADPSAQLPTVEPIVTTSKAPVKASKAPVAPPKVAVAPATPKAPKATPKAPAKVVAPATAPAPVVAPVAPRCEEDMPCWDCETMGNGQCGPGPMVPVNDYVLTEEDCAIEALAFDPATNECIYYTFAK